MTASSIERGRVISFGVCDAACDAAAWMIPSLMRNYPLWPKADTDIVTIAMAIAAIRAR